jgi:hypothetical protein
MNISTLSITMSMIIFKTAVSDKQVEEYKRPEGTRNPECGGGMNCSFCTLKMLGVYNPTLDEKSKTCGPRAKSGNQVKPEEYIPAIKQVIADMTTEDHEFKFLVESGIPKESLKTIADYLQPGEACFFIYGRANAGTHAVVLRKDQIGVLELIDPQRGSDDIGKEYGFTEERAAELGIESTPEYYSVRELGGGEIEEVMIEQSLLFGYWKTRKELMDDIEHFVVGGLMVDSVVGLTMLVEDTVSPGQPIILSKRPREHEPEIQLSGKTVVPPPEKRLRVDGSAPEMMDVDYYGGGEVTVNIKKRGGTQDDGYATLTEEAVEIPPLYSLIADLIAFPPDKDGNAVLKYAFVTIDNDEDVVVEGGGDKRKRSVSDDSGSTDTSSNKRQKTTPEDAATEYSDLIKEYPEKMSAIRDFVFRQKPGTPPFPASQPFRDIPDIVSTTQLILSGCKENEKLKIPKLESYAFLGIPRSNGWEFPGAGDQCINIRKGYDNNPNCWLCGNKTNNFTGMGISSDWAGKLTLCDPTTNQFECEHILPAAVMKFLGYMYTNAGKDSITAIEKTMMTMLYDGGCHTCNSAVKSDKLYMSGRQQPDGKIKFEPNILVILVDVIGFAMQLGMSEHPDKNICANGQDAVMFPIERKKRDGSIETAQGKFTTVITSGDKQYPNLIRALLTEPLTGNQLYQRAQQVNTSAIQRGDYTMIVERGAEAEEPLRELRTKDNLLQEMNAYINRENSLMMGQLLNRIHIVPINLMARVPQVEIKSENKNATSAAMESAKKLQNTVKLPAMVDWILERYVKIYNRMKQICTLFNQDVYNNNWRTRLASIPTSPALSLADFQDARTRISPPPGVGLSELTVKTNELLNEAASVRAAILNILERESHTVGGDLDIRIRRQAGGSYRKTIGVELMQVDD